MKKIIYIISLLIIAITTTFICIKISNKKELKDQKISTTIDRLTDRDHTALRVMRDYRLKTLKEGCPNAIWKLLEAKSGDDIIFEWTVPLSGPFPSTYHLERIVVGEYTYQKISYEFEKQPKDLSALIDKLRKTPTDVTTLPRDAPKRFA